MKADRRQNRAVFWIVIGLLLIVLVIWSWSSARKSDVMTDPSPTDQGTLPGERE